MAVQQKTISVSHRDKPKHKRPGVVSKTKTSSNKHSKDYKKPYRGQGR